MPTVAFIRENIVTMQTRPFDGVAFKLTEDHPPYAFDTRLWSDDEMQMDMLAEIDWGNLTDNFIILWASHPVTLDWFDDARWQTSLANLRLLSKTMKVAQVKGIFFDPEFYHYKEAQFSPWQYSAERYPDHTFEDMETIVRQRGSEFMSALQIEMPELYLLSFFAVSEVYAESQGIEANIPATRYALLRAFFNGILEAAAPDVVIIDGNEAAYSFSETRQFTDKFKLIRDDSPVFIAPELRVHYSRQVQAANALYLDWIAGLRPEEHHTDLPWDYRMKWLEHNVYHALRTTDKYAWLYSENNNWWTGDVKPGIEDVIRSARQKLVAGQSLGYDMVFQDGIGSVFVDN